MKEISNTKLLVSLHHMNLTFASMAVFDISNKDQIKKIYSPSLVTGNGIFIFSLSSSFE